MKKYFSEYRFTIRLLAKQFKIKPADVLSAMSAIDAQQPSQKNLELKLVALAEQDVLKNGTHYFVECEPLVEHMQKIGKNYDPRFLEVLLDENIASGVIHPCGSQFPAVLFWWNKKTQSLVIADSRYTEIFYGSKPSTEDNPSRNLLFGLCMYVACFPNAMRDGYPEFAKHPAHFDALRCASIGAVKEVSETDGPTPHFRAGHYRILRSEKFKHKRWQVIFVREAFVGGKVKTVTEVEPKPREL